MLTIFACPKPFHGHINNIQRNAIKSWTFLKGHPEIILIGNEEGVSQVCAEFNLEHIPDVKRNHLGTPLVSSIFDEAQKKAQGQFMCYFNSDIILKDDFSDAVDAVTSKFQRFLIVGNRWDVDISNSLDFSTGWQERLGVLAALKGKLHGHTGIDFFVLPKDSSLKIPPFAVGRPLWDNWLIYKCRSQGIPVIDITRAAIIFHQNHNYFHCQEGDYWKGEEVRQNLKLAGGFGHVYSVLQSSHILTKKGIKPNFSIHRFYYEINRWSRRLLSKFASF